MKEGSLQTILIDQAPAPLVFHVAQKRESSSSCPLRPGNGSAAAKRNVTLHLVFIYFSGLTPSPAQQSFLSTWRAACTLWLSQHLLNECGDEGSCGERKMQETWCSLAPDLASLAAAPHKQRCPCQSLSLTPPALFCILLFGWWGGGAGWRCTPLFCFPEIAGWRPELPPFSASSPNPWGTCQSPSVPGAASALKYPQRHVGAEGRGLPVFPTPRLLWCPQDGAPRTDSSPK